VNKGRQISEIGIQRSEYRFQSLVLGLRRTLVLAAQSGASAVGPACDGSWELLCRQPQAAAQFGLHEVIRIADANRMARNPK
jgi:hypothetical protein